MTAEYHLVDNNSDDDSVEIARDVLPGMKVVKNSTNRGFGAAVNQAAVQCNGDYLLLLNPDVELEKDSLEALLDAYSHLPLAGLVVPRLSDKDGLFHANCRKFPTVENLIWSRGSWLSKISRRTSERYTLPDYQVTTVVPAVSATVLLVKRAHFEKIGGFEPRFFMYMEDTDLSLRMQNLGLRNYFVPTARAKHFWGEGSAMSQLKRSALHHWSLWKYFLKHHPNGFSIVVLPALLAANYVASNLIAVFRK